MHAYGHMHVCCAVCRVHAPHAMLCSLFAVFRVGHTALRQSQERFFSSLGLYSVGRQIPGEQNATFCKVSKALGTLTALMAT